jgi:hypothetical protein
MTQVIEALKEGRVIEAFGAGTAAVVSPIKCIHYRGKVRFRFLFSKLIFNNNNNE